MAGYADVVESVDRLKLVGALSRAAAARRPADRPLRCLVQVCLDDEPGRGGAQPQEVAAIAAAIAAAPGADAGWRDGRRAARRRTPMPRLRRLADSRS